MILKGFYFCISGGSNIIYQRTIGPVIAQLVSEPVVSTTPGYKLPREFSVQAFILKHNMKPLLDKKRNFVS